MCKARSRLDQHLLLLLLLSFRILKAVIISLSSSISEFNLHRRINYVRAVTPTLHA